MEDLARYLARQGKFKLAASAEFVENPAALPAFQSAYGFTLGQDQLLILAGGNTAATIRAAAERSSGVNAAMAYGTDGAIAALGLTVLADTKAAQIVYAPAPVVRGAVLRRYPEIRGMLEAAFASLSMQALQELNAKITVKDSSRVGREDVSCGRRVPEVTGLSKVGLCGWRGGKSLPAWGAWGPAREREQRMGNRSPGPQSRSANARS